MHLRTTFTGVRSYRATGRPAPRPGHGPAEALLDLQRSAGNAAVTALIVQRKAPGRSTPAAKRAASGPTTPGTLTLDGIGVLPVEAEISMGFIQGLKNMYVGGQRHPELIPTKLAMDSLRVEVPKSAADGLLRHHRDLVMGGKLHSAGDLHGVLVLHRSTRGRASDALTIDLHGLRLFSVVRGGSTVKAEFNVGNLAVTSKAGTPPPKSAVRGTIAWEGGATYPLLGFTDLGREPRRYEVVLQPDPRIDRYVNSATRANFARHNLTITPKGGTPVEMRHALVEKVAFATAKGAATVTIRFASAETRQAPT